MDFSNLYINLSGKSFNSLAEAKAAGAPTINYGVFMNVITDFVIVGLVIFMMIQLINKLQRPAAPEDAPAPAVKDCPYCFSSISIKAIRCPHCTSEIK